MFRHQFTAFFVTALSLMIFWGCGKKSPVLVHIGQNTVITLADYQKENPGITKRDSVEGDIQRMKTLLDPMIDNKLILLAAIDAGYNENAKVLIAKKIEEERALLQKLYEHEIIDKYVKEADIRDYYIKSGKQVTLRKIYFAIPSNADSAETASVRSEAENVLKQIHDGANFNFMASRYSHDSRTSMRGGLMGVKKYTSTNDPILNAAFSMKKGEVSDIIESPDGLTILKVDDIEKIPQKSYPEERARIKNILIQSNITTIQKSGQAYLKDLKTNSNIQLNKENIDSLVHIMRPWNTFVTDSVMLGLSGLSDPARKMELATYKGGKVSVSDLQDWMSRSFGDRIRNGLTNARAIESSLDMVLQSELLTQVAMNNGLDRDADVQERITHAFNNAMIQQFTQNVIFADIDPKDRELRSETKQKWLEEQRTKNNVTLVDSEIKRYIESLYKEKS